MSYILNIETATKNCSVSIAQNGKTIVCHEAAEAGFSHAEKLHVFIEQCLVDAGLSFKDLEAIAVSQGPGSYTGLRIGVSAAKGLCYALGLPLIAVDTLKVLASQASVKEGVVIPMLDARRMEVYSAIFDVNLIKQRETLAEIITEDSFKDQEGPIYFVGDCAQKCKPILTDDKFVFLEDSVYPSAKDLSFLSYELLKNKATVDVAYFEPFYLKDFMITTSKK